MRITLVIVTFLWVCIKVNAQNYELGKVTIAELQEKVNPNDTTAPAKIVFKRAKTTFVYTVEKGFTAVHVYEFKIKIYKKEGLKWADKKVPFYIGYEKIDPDRLEFSNAVTYNLENGTVVKTKLDGQGTFKNNINKYWREKSITLPNVKVGSIIEFKYVLKSEYLVKFPDFEFQYEIPVDYVEYKTEIPEFYIYKPIVIGQKDIKFDQKLENGHQGFVNSYRQSSTMSYRQINSVYSGKAIPALQNEPFVDNVENYKSCIQHELERVRMPEEPVKDYAMTWEGVATTIFKSDEFGKELKERSIFIEDVKRLVDKLESKQEKLEIIFKFVQNRMNWNEKNDCYADKGVVEAYKTQVGNVADINFILIDMLKLAGIETNPVLVSTIGHGIPVYPTRTGFNYVIAAAEIDGKQILLDASHKFTVRNILPINVLNWKGRLVKSNGTSQEIGLVPTDVSRETVNMMTKMDSLGQLKGQIRIQKTDYDAYRFRVDNATVNQDHYLEKLEGKFGDVKISNYVIENKRDNLSKDITETFEFATGNQADIIGGKLYIYPMLFFTKTKNPFTQEKRQMPIYFGYPTQERYNINLEIPEGYEIESLPTVATISSENKEIFFVLNMKATENKIQISCLKEIKGSIFAAESYNGIKELFQKMIASQSQKIVLKKI